MIALAHFNLMSEYHWKPRSKDNFNFITLLLILLCAAPLFYTLYLMPETESLMAQDWEVLLARPFDEVRIELGLEPPTFYLRSRPMHDASRSKSRAAVAEAISV